MLNAARASYQSDPYVAFKYINMAEGYSCYESYVGEIKYLVGDAPLSPSTFPRFVTLLRSIDRPASYYRTPEYDEVENCRPPMPLQEEDFVSIVSLVREKLPKSEGDKFLEALKYHFRPFGSRLHNFNSVINNSMNNNDADGLLDNIKAITDALDILDLLNSIGRQKVAVKMVLEDKILQRFPNILNFFTTQEADNSNMMRRLLLPNRPFLPIKKPNSLNLVGIATSGRQRKRSQLVLSTPSSSSSDECNSPNGSSDSDSNSPLASPKVSKYQTLADRKRTYLRHAGSRFVILLNRCLVESDHIV